MKSLLLYKKIELIIIEGIKKYSELAVKCFTPPATVASTTYIETSYLNTLWAVSLKPYSFLRSNVCFFIGRVSVALEYLRSARPGRKISKESFLPFISVSINSSEHFR